jgi:hypothetical protein
MKPLEDSVRRSHKVEKVSDTSSAGEGIDVELKKGFAFKYNGIMGKAVHDEVFPNWRGAYGAVVKAMPCGCPDCV